MISWGWFKKNLPDAFKTVNVQREDSKGSARKTTDDKANITTSSSASPHPLRSSSRIFFVLSLLSSSSSSLNWTSARKKKTNFVKKVREGRIQTSHKKRVTLKRPTVRAVVCNVNIAHRYNRFGYSLHHVAQTVQFEQLAKQHVISNGQKTIREILNFAQIR